MFCKKCGRKTEGNEKFCTECGNSFQEDPISREPTRTKKNIKMYGITLAIVVGVTVIMSTGYYFLLNNNNGHKNAASNQADTIASSTATCNIDSTNVFADDEVKQKYRKFFGEKYGWENKKANPCFGNAPNKYNVFLADLTHDGIDEMIVLDDTVDDEQAVELTVYSYCDREINKIYSNSSTKMPRDKLFGLYNDDGLIYLLVCIDDMWMNGGNVSYEVFSLSETGSKKNLTSETYSQTLDPNKCEELGSGYYDFIDRKEEILRETIILFDCCEIYVRQSDPNIALENSELQETALIPDNTPAQEIYENANKSEEATSLPKTISYRPGIIAAGTNCTILLRNDGRVLTIGTTTIDTSNWKDIIQVAADGGFAIGLKSDGTLVAAGDLSNGEGEVYNWKDVVQVACGNQHTIAVTSKGTVYFAGIDKNDIGQCLNWTHVKKVLAGSDHVAAILDDGTVISAGYPASKRLHTESFQDVVEGDIGTGSTFCVLDDGTVKVTGKNFAGEDNIEGWTDIIGISAENEHTVGLRGDGTVIAVGSNHFGECNTSEWTDIVAIATGKSHTVAVRADGMVVAIGNDRYGQIDVDGLYLW